MPRSLRIALLTALATAAAAAPAHAASTLELGVIEPATQEAGGDVAFGDVHMTAYGLNETEDPVDLYVYIDSAECAADKATEAAKATAQPGIKKELGTGNVWHTFSLTPDHAGGTFNVCAYLTTKAGDHLAAAPARSFTATRLPEKPIALTMTLPTPGDQAAASVTSFAPIRWTVSGSAPYGNAMLMMWLSERADGSCPATSGPADGLTLISGSTVQTGEFSVDFDVSPGSAGSSSGMSFSRMQGTFAGASPRTLCAYLTKMPPGQSTVAHAQGGRFKLTLPASPAAPAAPAAPAERNVITLPARRFTKSGRATVEILLGKVGLAKATKRVKKGRKVGFSFTLSRAAKAALATAGPNPIITVRTTLKPKRGKKRVTTRTMTLP